MKIFFGIFLFLLIFLVILFEVLYRISVKILKKRKEINSLPLVCKYRLHDLYNNKVCDLGNARVLQRKDGFFIVIPDESIREKSKDLYLRALKEARACEKCWNQNKLKQ